MGFAMTFAGNSDQSIPGAQTRLAPAPVRQPWSQNAGFAEMVRELQQ
jgi:hypothetical protein